MLQRLALFLLFALIPAVWLAASQATSPGAAEARANSLAECRRRVEADNRNNPVESVRCAEASLLLLKDGADPKTELWFLLALIRDLNALGDYEKAMAYTERARPLAARHGEPLDRFQVEVSAAALRINLERYQDCRAPLDALLPQMEAHVSKFPGDLDARMLMGRAHRLSGMALTKLGLLTQAIQAFSKAQKVYSEIGDARGQGMVLTQIAAVYQELGRLEEAIQFRLQAVALAEAVGDVGIQASLRVELSNLYALSNDADRQLAELKRASQLAAKAQDADTLLAIAVNLADVYLRKKDYPAALKNAEEALRLSRKANDPASTALSRVNRGIALNRLGESTEGLREIQAGLEHFKRTESKSLITEITGILAEELAFAGDFRQAYEAHVAFKTLGDAFLKAESQKHIAEASAAFESDKKQFQIDALKREGAIQSRLRLLWITLGVVGFSTAIVLVLGRRKLRAANRALADMSLHDPLTSLANRRYLASRIEEDLALIHRLHRNPEPEPSSSHPRTLVNIDVVFFMIDIDHFKQVNDQHGHAAGDAVLKQFAAILTGAMRDSDTVVQWGGEEFFILAKQTTKADAHLVAERIRSRVAEASFDLGNGTLIRKTCSLGFASYPFFHKAPDRIPWEKVVELADQCLYAAKTNGRDTWVGVHAAERALLEPLPLEGGAFLVPTLLDGGYLAVESRSEAPLLWPTAHP